MNVLKGIPVSEGIVFGKLKAYRKDYFGVHSVKIHTKDHDKEILKLSIENISLHSGLDCSIPS